MPLIQWTEQLSVNIRQIDTQHQHLIELVNALHDSMKTGKGKEILEEVLNALAAYTASHFSTEEKLMRTHGFPGCVLHVMEHDKLTTQVERLKSKYQSGKAVLTMEVMQFLKDWLTHHIQGTDKQYSAFLNSKGVV